MRFSLLPRDRTFFDLFNEAGQNTLRAAGMLDEMMGTWPDDNGLGREILIIEQEGDRITHDRAWQPRAPPATATPRIPPPGSRRDSRRAELPALHRAQSAGLHPRSMALRRGWSRGEPAPTIDTAP